MAVAATGFFDGVHLGHRAIIETLVNCARERNEQSLVVTFRPHPRAVLQNDAHSLRLLSSEKERLSMLEALGVDRVEVLPFTRELASVDTAGYLRLLSDVYGVSAIVLGYDNRIGSDQLSPAETARLAVDMGLKVFTVPEFDSGGGAVSSSLIRRTLEQGNVEEASRMLGYDYALDGVVVSGKRLGRTIGYPTANMQMSDPLKLIPGRGVYATGVRTLGRDFFGMTNVGDVLETHIFDFKEDIYGLDIKVRFLARLRGEMKFNGVEELKNQLEKDEISVKNLIFGK